MKLCVWDVLQNPMGRCLLSLTLDWVLPEIAVLWGGHWGSEWNWNVFYKFSETTVSK